MDCFRIFAMRCGSCARTPGSIVGLQGIMTYSVTRRTREIGVRMALGAQSSGVLAMVLRDAAVLLGGGMIAGIGALLASTSLLQSMLYGTGPRDPLVLTMVCIAVAFAGLAAAYIPALRAAAVDPMVALPTNKENSWMD
jgi:putative ABC transport system permease protein